MQEAAAEKFEQLFEADAGENLEPNVGKMLAKKEDLAGTPYRTRTCDPLIKSQICSLTWKVIANARRSLTSL